jgi:hypothetical protein
MKNKGKSQYRFKDNPLEREFAKSWEEMNIDHAGRLDGKGTLDYMLAEHINDPRGEVTSRDRMVAATVIQWLGSPVGQSFLGQMGNIRKP